MAHLLGILIFVILIDFLLTISIGLYVRLLTKVLKRIFSAFLIVWCMKQLSVDILNVIELIILIVVEFLSDSALVIRN